MTRCQLQAWATDLQTTLIGVAKAKQLDVVKASLQEIPASDRTFAQQMFFMGRDSVPKEAVLKQEPGRAAVTWVGGALLAIALVGTILIPNPTPSQGYVLRVVLSLGAGAFGVFLSGTIQVHGKLAGLGVKATGGLAVFVLVYWVTPSTMFGVETPDHPPSGLSEKE